MGKTLKSKSPVSHFWGQLTFLVLVFGTYVAATLREEGIYIYIYIIYIYIGLNLLYCESVSNDALSTSSLPVCLQPNGFLMIPGDHKSL